MSKRHHYNCQKCENWVLREDGKTYGCKLIDNGDYPILTVNPKSNRYPNHMVCRGYNPVKTEVTVTRKAVKLHVWMNWVYQCSSCRELMGPNHTTCPHCGAELYREVN